MSDLTFMALVVGCLAFKFLSLVAFAFWLARPLPTEGRSTSHSSDRLQHCLILAAACPETYTGLEILGGLFAFACYALAGPLAIIWSARRSLFPSCHPEGRERK